MKNNKPNMWNHPRNKGWWKIVLIYAILIVIAISVASIPKWENSKFGEYTTRPQ